MQQADAIDLKILDLLQRDARLSNQELADAVALSPSACHRRVKALEKNGLIAGYRAVLGYRKLGFRVEAFVELSLRELNEDAHQRIGAVVRSMPEVVDAYIVTGPSNYLLHVRVRDLEEYSRFVINRLNNLDGVTKIHSRIVLAPLDTPEPAVPG